MRSWGFVRKNPYTEFCGPFSLESFLWSRTRVKDHAVCLEAGPPFAWRPGLERPGLSWSRRVRFRRCLAPGGVYLSRRIASAGCELLPHNFTIASGSWRAHVVSPGMCRFCGTVPSHPDDARPPLAATVLDGVRTFLPPDVPAIDPWVLQICQRVRSLPGSEKDSVVARKGFANRSYRKQAIGSC